MRTLKVMTLSMMHKDRSLKSSPLKLRPTHMDTQTARLNAFLFLQEVQSNIERLTLMRLQPVQPTIGATVRTDGRKKAVLAWTVTNHRAGRKHGRRETLKKKTRPRVVINSCVFSCFIETLVVFDDKSRDTTETNGRAALLL